MLHGAQRFRVLQGYSYLAGAQQSHSSWSLPSSQTTNPFATEGDLLCCLCCRLRAGGGAKHAHQKVPEAKAAGQPHAAPHAEADLSSSGLQSCGHSSASTEFDDLHSVCSSSSCSSDYDGPTMQHSIADVADVAVMVSAIQVGAACICGTAGQHSQAAYMSALLPALAELSCRWLPCVAWLDGPGFCANPDGRHHSLLCLCNASFLRAVEGPSQALVKIVRFWSPSLALCLRAGPSRRYHSQGV